MLITFRDLKNTDNEYRQLHKWCSNKFVYEWFEQRILSYDEIVSKYQKKLKEKIQDIFIIKCDDNDIGLVQIYKYKDNIYEYDLFIGIEEYLNKGIGTIIVNEINDIIYKKYKANSIILRPFKRNIRAIKCYKKCGFKQIDEYLGKDTLGNPEVITVLEKKI